MSSSDSSDDDCYGNVVQRLQKMKNRYIDDKIANFLNDSVDLGNIVKNASSPSKNIAPKPPEKINEIDLLLNDKDDEVLNNLLAASSKRMTRASSRRSSQALLDIGSNSSLNDTANISETSAPRGKGKRGRGRGRKANKEAQAPRERQASTRPTRSPRGQSRRSRNISNIPEMFNIPTYSVGNTDEYPDQSDHQELFSNKSKPETSDVIPVEDNMLDENEELSVKVYWQSLEFFKFKIRKYQKLTQIFDYFSKKENVSHNKLLFTYNDRILKPDDTPDAIEYSIVKFIDGGIVNQSVSQLVTVGSKKVKNGIQIKFQCQNIKKPFETCIRLDDTLYLAMVKCAEHYEKPLDKLKFEFDGDSISGKKTARELELEGGECIDVKIIS